MPGYNRVGGIQPFITGGVNITMANPAIGNFDVYIPFTGTSSAYIHLFQAGICGLGSKGRNCGAHDF
jgi:hypothetical protein